MHINNELCIARPNLIDFNSNELYCYPFMVSLGRCYGSCNTLDDLSSRTYVPNKIEDVNLFFFQYDNKNKLIKNSNKTFYTIVMYIFDGRKCNLNQKWNKEFCKCEWKNLINHPVLFKLKIYLDS